MKISVFMEHILEGAGQEGISVEEMLGKVRRLGVSGVELDYGRIENDSTLVPVIKNADFEISCVYAFFDFAHSEDMSYAENVVDTLSACGIERLMAIPGFVEESDDRNICTERMLRCMNRLSQLAEKKNIALCLEDFDDEKAVFSTAQGLLGFMEGVEGLGCAFDTGNFIYSDENETDAFTLLEKYIVHLHCKDRSFTEKTGEEPKLTVSKKALYSSPVGYGAIKIEDIAKKLLKSGYDGWFAIEHFGSLNQLSDIEKSAEKLKEWYNDTCNCME